MNTEAGEAQKSTLVQGVMTRVGRLESTVQKGTLGYSAASSLLGCPNPASKPPVCLYCHLLYGKEEAS